MTTEADFDTLSRSAEASGGAADSLHALADAIFALPAWHFIARGELASPRPYTASHAATAGGVPMIRAFTDVTRLQRFARENNLHEEDGSVRMLSIPSNKVDIVTYVQSFQAEGAQGLWFNSDSGSAGFFFPLRNLRGIYDDVQTRAAAIDRIPTKLERADLAHLNPDQRRAVLAALCAAVFADGSTDRREVAALQASLALEVWGVAADVLAADFAEAQKTLLAKRTASDLIALGQACALAFPSQELREKLLKMMIEIAWLDAVFNPAEQQVIGMFAHGLGVARERLAALAAPKGDGNIFQAVANGDLDEVRRMLDAGTSVMSRDPRQWTPLHVAVATGREAIVELLLARGADVNAVHSQGSPPLLLACNKPLAAIVTRLLASGARPDAPAASGLHALHVAALTGQTAVARALRAGGASVDLADSSGETALHIAAKRRHGEIVAFLLAEGAAVDARTKLGCTSLHHAANSGDLVSVGALLAARADLHAGDVDADPLARAVRTRGREVDYSPGVT